MTDPTPEEIEAAARAIGYHLAALASRNNQPCMSGDPRDRISPYMRRDFDEACVEAATAALAAAAAVRSGPPESVEPVAWRYRHKTSDVWHLTDSAELAADCDDPAYYIVEPLYAAPPSEPQADT